MNKSLNQDVFSTFSQNRKVHLLALFTERNDRTVLPVYILQLMKSPTLSYIPFVKKLYFRSSHHFHVAFNLLKSCYSFINLSGSIFVYRDVKMSKIAMNRLKIYRYTTG